MLHSGIDLAPPGGRLPTSVRIIRFLTTPFSWFLKAENGLSPISAGFARLGPSYIKLGQFLATREDIVGEKLAKDFTRLQDRMPPFSMTTAQEILVKELGKPIHQLFEELSEPVAAASIAQVHKATISHNGTLKEVAIKILRPDVEHRFKTDLETFYFAAHMAERMIPAARRLRPIAIVDTLAHSVSLEMDLRLEAAAISEMAEYIKDDKGFRVPEVDWQHTTQRVLALEWIDGTPMNDLDGLRKAGHDLPALGEKLMQSFLLHAMRDGFFHADMHQGNMFVEADGTIVAIDFGIMGRLGPMEKRYLAEIIYGFVTRNYERAARFHFEAGYVPSHYSVGEFAQALRAVGEPIQDRPADEVSMGQFLGQLLQYTELFEMETRPELLMLQKTMVVVEGVARTLNPKLNMWRTAEPVVSGWMKEQLGVKAKVKEAKEGIESVGRFMQILPQLLDDSRQISAGIHAFSNSGIRLDNDSVERLSRAVKAKPSILVTILAAIGVLAIIYGAVKIIMGA